jgi:CelD/BcsL family acetyltransferase involved in cellulose biosynthesis
MTRFELMKWRDLSAADRGAWQAFREADARLRSPYFDLPWFDGVDRARDDLMVLRGSRAGSAVAFLAFHPGLMGVARPAGGTFCDWHGVVAEPGLALDTQALRQGPATFAFWATPKGDPLLETFVDSEEEVRAVDLSAGYEAYAAPKGGGAPKGVAATRKSWRKLEADGRRVEFIADDRNPETLRAVLRLKSEQYLRSGHADALSWGWSTRLMQALFDSRAALLSSLWIDGELAAGHFGLCDGKVLHHWMPVYDLRFSNYSPGSVLWLELARTLAAEGLQTMDLGVRDYRWKREFANTSTLLTTGVAHAPNAPGRFNAAAYGLGRRWSALPLGIAATAPHKLSRRLDRVLSARAPGPPTGLEPRPGGVEPQLESAPQRGA